MRMLLLILLYLTVRLSSIDTCPTFCRCYSAFDGYHVTCQNGRLSQLPSNLTRFLRQSDHQHIIVDLSSNLLTVIPCELLEISTIIILIVSRNRIESIPWCFSQSSIEILRLDDNRLRWNDSTLLSSSKLTHLDLSRNRLSSLPRTFFHHLRRLRMLVLTGQPNLFDNDNHQWIRSLTTRNQLTIVLCDHSFHLPLCLLENLFQSKKLFALELNSNLSCDCSLVYLPLDKLRFHSCQSSFQQGICNAQTSRFEHGHSLIHLQNATYRQLCAHEYQSCHQLPQLSTNHLNVSASSSSSISSVATTITTTTTTMAIVRVTPSKKEGMTSGAIISFVLLLVIVSLVCVYVILSGHFFQINSRPRMTDFGRRGKKQATISNINDDPNATRFEECLSIENLNKNSNSDEESDRTFYSVPNHKDSSTSFLHSSITEMEITSFTSSIHSSLSDETVVLSNRNKPRIY